MKRAMLALLVASMIGLGRAEAQPPYPGWGPPPPPPPWGPPMPPPWAAPYPPPRPYYPPPPYAPYPAYPRPMYGPPMYPMPNPNAPPPAPAPEKAELATTSEPPSKAEALEAPPEGAAAAPPGHFGGLLGDLVPHHSWEPVCANYKCWASGEYLLWFGKTQSVPALVTTGSPTDAPPGALGQPGTSVLYGDSQIRFPGMNGFRLTMGTWLNANRTLGIEASGFVLQSAVTKFYAASNSAGLPVLAVPFFNVSTGAEGTTQVSNPLGSNVFSTGNVGVVFTSQMWSGELNGVINVARYKGLDVDLLVGGRYVALNESFGLTTHTDVAATPAFAETVFNSTDLFRTLNQFYGAQLGVKATCQWKCLFASVIAKGAVGANTATLNVNGNTVVTSGGVSTTTPGGTFSQPSNIGTTSSTMFSAIPQVTFQVGWEVTPNIRIFAGYDFLYWYNVIRPGDQIDRNVNPTQAVGGTLVGAPVPATLLSRNNYYVQGINGGVQFRW